jgi:ubiquinone/menaquinone biosynthesis C-methylase UbiE
MTDQERRPDFDPYRPLGKVLKYSDLLNRITLRRSRQRIVQLLKGQKVLDVCCGTGNLAALLAAAGCQVVGVDSSATMLAHARRKRIAAEFKLMDATALPFDREFDAAVISIALHEMPPRVREKAWECMRRVVRPRGRLIALDFNVPPRIGLLARVARQFTERDERAFLNVHPEHYENFQEFMRHGGLHSWIQERGQPLEAEYGYWGGIIAIVVTR